MPKKSQKELVNGLIWWATYAVKSNKRDHNWHYQQVRPFPYHVHGKIFTDCTGGLGWLFQKMGLRDPYGMGHSGIGNTETLIARGKKLRIPRLQVRPGDVVVFSVDNPVIEQHAALVVRSGSNPLLWSMGQEGDPNWCRLSDDSRVPTFYRFPIEQIFDEVPRPEMPA